MPNRKQDPKTNSNLKVYLSLIELRQLEISQSIFLLKEQIKNDSLLKDLENIEKSLNTMHTLYTMSILDILSTEQDRINIINDIPRGSNSFQL